MVGSLIHAADHKVSHVHHLATKVTTTSYSGILNATNDVWDLRQKWDNLLATKT